MVCLEYYNAIISVSAGIITSTFDGLTMTLELESIVITHDTILLLDAATGRSESNKLYIPYEPLFYKVICGFTTYVGVDIYE